MIGEEIRRRRKERELTIEQLAARAGMAPSAISQIETGRRSPHSASVIKLAEALGCEVGDLYPKAPQQLSWEEELSLRGFPAEQIAAAVAENEHDNERIRRELEKWSANDWREALLAVSPRLRRYFREESTSRETTDEHQDKSA